MAVSGLPSQFSAQSPRPQARSVWLRMPASVCTIQRQRLAPTTDGIAQGRMTSTRIHTVPRTLALNTSAAPSPSPMRSATPPITQTSVRLSSGPVSGSVRMRM